MAKGTVSKITSLATGAVSSAMSVVRMMALSRPCGRVAAPEAPSLPLVVLGNGPSLSDTVATCGAQLAAFPLMAVNFAATAPEFFSLRPAYYVLADPHFFALPPSPNVGRLAEALARIDWPVTLFVPARERAGALRLTGGNPSVRVATFNPVAVEGFGPLENAAFDAGLGMPRPRNVLIPALMIALRLGFKTIYVAGADHSWMKTLEVSDDNTVVSVQPHFYREASDEKERITSVYKEIRLHEVIYSFYVAFRSYHTIARYARHCGAEIVNVTPGSYIDAFRRGSLAAVSVRPDATPSRRAENTRP